MRTDVDLLQTEWDVCGRELQAAAERVDTHNRVGAASAELAHLNRALDQQDLWLDSTAAVAEKRGNEAELRSDSGECQVRMERLRFEFHHRRPPSRWSSCIADSFINITVFSGGRKLSRGKIVMQVK